MIFEFDNYPFCVVMQEHSHTSRKMLLDLSSIVSISEGFCHASNLDPMYEATLPHTERGVYLKQEFTITTRSGNTLNLCSHPDTIEKLREAYKKCMKQARRDMVDYNFDKAMLNHAKATISETVAVVANSALKDLSGICDEAQESVAKINALSLNVNGVDAKIEEACESTTKLATAVDKLTRKIDRLMD